ncbi:prepilin peptidase [Bacillaceae bacterium IKA-2]|nr:prepilin peptidase [Bacillaceae bacterium IKA-2]
MFWINILLLIVLVICLITDLKSRKIYNKVLFPTLVIAFVGHFMISGWAGVGSASLGFLLGLAILLIPFLLGGMGAGDVKLLAVIGALKGSAFVLTTAIYMALVGGIIALVIILSKKGRAKGLFYHFWAKKHGIDLLYEKSALSATFPYGVAIVAGALLALYS